MHLAAVQTRGGASKRLYGEDGDSFEAKAPPVRNQGLCGSCWAISSVEAVEAQLLRANSSLSFQHGIGRLSPQAVLDCVRNPKHCGGGGGCGGATPQLAFEFMRDSGLPLEADVPYKMGTDECPMHKAWPSNRPHVTLEGWQELPSNRAQPLMQAIVELGPVAVSVSAQEWYPYRLGIYDECPKDCVPNHSVLAKGYGSEDGLGKYWLLQNSWGNQWGEQGAIRIRRHQDEDQWCGVDSQPQVGSSCDGGPASVTVCGSCGILYDSVVPKGARLELPERPGGKDYRDVVSESSADLMLSSYPAAAAAAAAGTPAAGAAPGVEPLAVQAANNVLVTAQDYDDPGAAHAANRMLSAYARSSEPTTEGPVTDGAPREEPAVESHADLVAQHTEEDVHSFPSLETQEQALSSSRSFALRADNLAPVAPELNNFRDTIEAMADDDLHLPGQPLAGRGQGSFVPMATDSSLHDASDVLDAYNSRADER